MYRTGVRSGKALERRSLGNGRHVEDYSDMSLLNDGYRADSLTIVSSWILKRNGGQKVWKTATYDRTPATRSVAAMAVSAVSYAPALQEALPVVLRGVFVLLVQD